jgi:mannose-6-phosphate isomerase-like protein (cupin superfamily)
VTHVHLGTLTYIANLLGRETVFRRLLEFAEDKWIDDDGCQYVSLSGTAVIEHIARFIILDDVDIELVKVTGTLAPHVHQHSDFVAIAKGVFEDDADVWIDIDRDWHTMEDGRLVVIPRGVPHGFRIDPVSREPFYLIVVTNPPLREGDTAYIQ